MVANLRNVDENLARRVADGLGIELPTKAKAAREPVDMALSDALSIHKNMEDTLEGRAVGILIADGTDANQLNAVVAAVTRAKGKAVIIAPKIGGATLSDGKVRRADGQLAGSPAHRAKSSTQSRSSCRTRAPRRCSRRARRSSSR
jgi:catalase